MTLTPTGFSRSKCQISCPFHPAYFAPNNRSSSEDLCPISYSEQLVFCSTPKLEAHPPSAVRDWLFNMLAAAIHTSIRNVMTRHAVPNREAFITCSLQVPRQPYSPLPPSLSTSSKAWNGVIFRLRCVYRVNNFFRLVRCDHNDGVERVTMRPNVLIQRDRKGFVTSTSRILHCAVMVS